MLHILYSLLCSPYSWFHQYLCVFSTDWWFRYYLEPCILTISFIFSFFIYLYASLPNIKTGIKQASKSFNCTLVSSFPTWFFDSIISIPLLLASHFCFDSSVIPHPTHSVHWGLNLPQNHPLFEKPFKTIHAPPLSAI